MKKFLVVFFILLAISIIFALWWVKRAWSKVTINLKVENIDLGGITIEDIAAILLTGQTQSAKVIITLNADIKNDNSFSIPFSIKKIKLFYQGSLIAETSETLAIQKFEVQQKSSLSVKDNLNVLLNTTSIKLLKEKVLLKQQPVIDYYVKIKILKIPFALSFKKNFIWK
ncbi:MAG: hypothetical protein US53_C0070G0009 [Candidatus Woesebacteria bacterium GW2011_GWA1_37_7]|uniref:Uncharacterized protein n=1 Tax=Candidatus Woesebacteria bacterium GW2011_GWA1_37_7 TaxID=1618545 RepID=A0A0G0HBA8_9BACT|nr:MAG: hypothetical protein US53_C0070G0009 [Candidatus Woesebacteria bacterium GW2011_GWA1_37_7]